MELSAVHNYQDGRKFRELMARHSLRVDYTVLQKRPKTSSAVLAAKSPDQSYRHFLSLLKVDDDWVFNALCEAQNLHRVVRIFQCYITYVSSVRLKRIC